MLLHCVVPEETVEKPAPIPEPEPKISKELEDSKYNEWKKENLAQQKKNSQNFLLKNKLKLDKTPLFYEDKIYFGMTQIEVLEILDYSFEKIIELSSENQIETKLKTVRLDTIGFPFPEYKFYFKENTLYGVSVFLNTPIQDTFDALKYKYGKSKINSRIQNETEGFGDFRKISFKVDEHYWTKNNIEIYGNICYAEDREQYKKYLKEARYCYYAYPFADVDIFYCDKRIGKLIQKENAEIEANKVKEKAKKL